MKYLQRPKWKLLLFLVLPVVFVFCGALTLLTLGAFRGLEVVWDLIDYLDLNSDEDYR